MLAYKIERGRTLSQQTYELLCEKIKTMSARDNRMPSEDELSQEFGVSRATIRDACNQLIAEGYINKTTGRGMLAHPSAFSIKNRIDMNSDFRKLLEQDFEHVELEISGVETIHESTADRLTPSAEEYPLFCMDWTYIADGKKVIYGKFKIPTSNFKKFPRKDFQVHDLTEFSRSYLSVPISYCAMYIKCGFDAKAAQILGIDEHQPIQCWDEVLVGVNDMPIGYSTFYLHPQEVVMSVLTKFR